MEMAPITAKVKKEGMTSVLSFSPFAQTELNKVRDGVRVEIRPLRNVRSSQQHRYYWVYLTLIAGETGHDKEELHEWAKGRFLTDKIVELFGSKTRIRRSTTTLTKAEFSEYIMQIEAATGIVAPPPEDYLTQ